MCNYTCLIKAKMKVNLKVAFVLINLVLFLANIALDNFDKLNDNCRR